MKKFAIAFAVFALSSALGGAVFAQNYYPEPKPVVVRIYGEDYAFDARNIDGNNFFREVDLLYMFSRLGEIESDLGLLYLNVRYIDGYQYFMLREAVYALGFWVEWNDEELVVMLISEPPIEYEALFSSLPRLPMRRIEPEELEFWILAYEYLGGISGLELAIFDITNEIRLRHGLPELMPDPELFMAARFKSQEMIQLRYMAHESPIYGQFVYIPLLFGRDVGAENIHSMNYHTSAERVVDGWMNSYSHRVNILNPNFRYMGIGVYHNDYAFELYHRGRYFRLSGGATQFFAGR